MASYGEGFSRGMSSGMATGKLLMDIYNEYDQKDKLRQAGEEAPTEIGGLSKDQQTTADYVNDAKNGYEVQKLDNGGFQYRTAGSDNSWTEVTPGAKKWKLGDKVQDTEFSKDQIAAHRADRQAQVLMDAGDIKGAYGLKAMAREDRKGQQWDDINQSQINDLQSLAEGKYENLRGTLEKGVQRYNDAKTGQYADGHKMTIDWENNQAIVSKDNAVVKKIPITQQSAAQFIRAYYDDLRSAANPEYGLKRDEIGIKRDDVGIKRDALTESGRHNRAIEGLTAQRNGLIGALNPAQQYALDQQKKYDLAKDQVIAELEAGKITEQAAVKKIGLLGMKFGQGAGSGLGKADEAQVEYDPETGQKKIKGTASQVAAYERTDPKTKAATGDLSVTQPTKNQTGVETPRDAQKAEAKPDLSKWTMKPAGKTIWGETDYVLEGPSGRMTLGDFIKRYGYNPSAEFIGRR